MATYSNQANGYDTDNLSCTFYHKIGACRHGDRCSRNHIKPTSSTVVMCSNLHRNPVYEYTKFQESQSKQNGEEQGLSGKTSTSATEDRDRPISEEERAKREKREALEQKFRKEYPEELINSELPPREIQLRFNQFYSDIFVEMGLKYGIVEDLAVTENFNHLNGNVFIMFRSEASAIAAVRDINSRWYNGRPVFAELSPVKSFHEAICGSYSDTGECTRSVNCNFWHIRNPEPALKDELFLGQKKYYLQKGASDDQYSTRRV